jgi:hypothetical protein
MPLRWQHRRLKRCQLVTAELGARHSIAGQCRHTDTWRRDEATVGAYFAFARIVSRVGVR